MSRVLASPSLGAEVDYSAMAVQSIPPNRFLFSAILVSLVWFAGAAACAAAEVPSSPATKVLRGGWYPWDPYQYREYRHGVPVLTGFDVEIERAVARALGVELVLTDLAWEDHLAALARGTADIAAGATYSEERNSYAYFS